MSQWEGAWVELGLVSTWEKLVALIGWCAVPPAVGWGLGGCECGLIGLSSWAA